MCIIIYKPNGEKMPSYQTLKECFYNNPDGAGFMYCSGGKVVVRKGFMLLEELTDALNDLSKEINITGSDIVLHFRYATHGEISGANCHPFPVSNKVADLQAEELSARAAIVHNGTISFCGSKHVAKKNPTLSDTQIFVKDYLSAMPIASLTNRAVQGLILEATNSRFVIMTPRRVSVLGDFIIDKGIYYSNSTYKQSRYKYRTAGYKHWAEYDQDGYTQSDCAYPEYDYCDYCGNLDVLIEFDEFAICQHCFDLFTRAEGCDDETVS